jgi:hypothetical protein
MSNTIEFDTGSNVIRLQRNTLSSDFYDRVTQASQFHSPNHLVTVEHQRLGSNSALYNLYWFVDCNSILASKDSDMVDILLGGWSALTVRDLRNVLKVINSFYQGTPIDVYVNYRDEGDGFEKSQTMWFSLGTTRMHSKEVA